MTAGYMNTDPRTDPDAARYATALAGQMTAWLGQPDANPTTYASADLVEWCRSARDLLERIGGTPGPQRCLNCGAREDEDCRSWCAYKPAGRPMPAEPEDCDICQTTAGCRCNADNR